MPAAPANPLGTSTVSPNALVCAKRVLRWIIVVPGGTRVMASVDMVLDIAKGFDAVSNSTDPGSPS